MEEMVHSVLFHWTPPRNHYQISLDKDVAEQPVKNQKHSTLSREKMQQLVENYWTANKSNRHKAFPQFWKSVSHILKRYNFNCNGRHSYELRNCWATPPSII